jgi:DNA helicase-2/ATP-dependent DNA helicase PcrA
MSNEQELLLAGPGTGKTTYIKNLLKDYDSTENILILSFTKATIRDLLKNFKENSIDITPKQCMTVHQLAFKINPKKNLYILDEKEDSILNSVSKKLNIEFGYLCKILQCETFNQMIENSINIIKNNPVYIQDELGILDLLIIDEYQDLNENDREFVSLLFPLCKKILVLGDDDQSIYEFRDASNKGIISIYNDTNFTKIPYDNICHRCPGNVVDCCNSLISHNKDRIDKYMQKERENGTLIKKQFLTQQETAIWIVNEINKIKKVAENQHDSIMILSPVKVATSKLVSELDKRNIKYSNLYSKKTSLELEQQIWEISSIYLKNNLVPCICSILTDNNSTKKESFIKAFNQQLKTNTEYEEMQHIVYPFLKARVIKAIRDGTDINLYITDTKLSKLEEILEEKDPEEEIFTYLRERRSQESLFNEQGINIMSIHKSKGLSADHVFILGLVDGFLPNKSKNLQSIEEQRRILYVGMSRAKKSLYLISTLEWTYSQIKKGDESVFKWKSKNCLHGLASPFLSELENTVNYKEKDEK